MAKCKTLVLHSYSTGVTASFALGHQYHFLFLMIQIITKRIAIICVIVVWRKSFFTVTGVVLTGNFSLCPFCPCDSSLEFGGFLFLFLSEPLVIYGALLIRYDYCSHSCFNALTPVNLVCLYRGVDLTRQLCGSAHRFESSWPSFLAHRACQFNLKHSRFQKLTSGCNGGFLV